MAKATKKTVAKKAPVKKAPKKTAKVLKLKATPKKGAAKSPQKNGKVSANTGKAPRYVMLNNGQRMPVFGAGCF